MKKQINIIAMHLAYGGVEKAVCAMANLFIEMGYPVKIICTYNMPDAPAYPLDEKVEIEYLLKDIPNRQEFREAVRGKNPYKIVKEGFRSVKILYQKKTRVKKAIAHIHEGIIITTRHEDSLVLSRIGDKNVYKIAQLHHDHEFKDQYVQDFKKNYNGIDCFCLLTDKLRDEVAQMMLEGGNTHTKCVTVPNFVDELPKPRHTPLTKQCISVGRLHPVKGFDRLIKLFTKIHEQDESVALKIVGSGEEFERLNNQIHESNAEHYITLTGAKHAEEVSELLDESGLYLMTSHSEGLPFVLIEAMSHGLPCIAYDVRVGPSAIIQDSLDGYLIPDNDEDLYVRRCLEVLSDRQLQVQMSNQARQKSNFYTKAEVQKIWKVVLMDESCK